MAAKEIHFRDSARAEIKKGVDTLANAVSSRISFRTWALRW